uniref:Uncharacterized protein n=1 Tax=Arion vulgaris TaxID=1028688 RepID=A0A0B6YQ05_9EUPU
MILKAWTLNKQTEGLIEVSERFEFKKEWNVFQGICVCVRRGGRGAQIIEINDRQN